MPEEIQEIFGVLDMLLDDLTAALSEIYPNVKIDINISARPNHQSVMGIPPLNQLNSRITRF